MGDFVFILINSRFDPKPMVSSPLMDLHKFENIEIPLKEIMKQVS